MLSQVLPDRGYDAIRQCLSGNILGIGTGDLVRSFLNFADRKYKRYLLRFGNQFMNKVLRP